MMLLRVEVGLHYDLLKTMLLVGCMNSILSPATKDYDSPNDETNFVVFKKP